MYSIFIFIKFYWIGTLFWCFFITLIISKHLVWLVPLKYNGSQDLVINKKEELRFFLKKPHTFRIIIWLHPLLVLPWLWWRMTLSPAPSLPPRMDYYLAFGIFFFILSFEEIIPFFFIFQIKAWCLDYLCWMHATVFKKEWQIRYTVLQQAWYCVICSSLSFRSFYGDLYMLNNLQSLAFKNISSFFKVYELIIWLSKTLSTRKLYFLLQKCEPTMD